ncbi:unnamed protein product [Blepharisma stoltei]|uniref:C3H1-type domain-containing protein n=1 Tax=Blepharisma stoltei TaxID=1481888 RepID=A0AAU9K6G5_9CILI|nr:unnamed protein product [Blepharisma stoltei]
METISEIQQPKIRSQKPPKSGKSKKNQNKSALESSQAKKKSTKADFQTKFKSEICKNWENGYCEFGSECAFAHGESELRDKPQAKNYKTQRCKQFHELGYCIYGSRCQFIHRDLSPDTADNSPVGSRVSSRKGSFDASKDSSKKRLPIFVDLERRGI